MVVAVVNMLIKMMAPKMEEQVQILVVDLVVVVEEVPLEVELLVQAVLMDMMVELEQIAPLNVEAVAVELVVLDRMVVLVELMVTVDQHSQIQ